LLLFESAEDQATLAAITAARHSNGRVGALTRRLVIGGMDLLEQLPKGPVAYARDLYGALHRMDDAGATLILVERPPADSDWDAVRDRLERAARP
jgi:L-threonylcarbamoyladenylate synthase